VVNHRFERKLKVTDLFNYGTVRELANLIQDDPVPMVSEEKFDEFEL
jgi:hypothetical protein